MLFLSKREAMLCLLYLGIDGISAVELRRKLDDMRHRINDSDKPFNLLLLEEYEHHETITCDGPLILLSDKCRTSMGKTIIETTK